MRLSTPGRRATRGAASRSYPERRPQCSRADRRSRLHGLPSRLAPHPSLLASGQARHLAALFEQRCVDRFRTHRVPGGQAAECVRGPSSAYTPSRTKFTFAATEVQCTGDQSSTEPTIFQAVSVTITTSRYVPPRRTTSRCGRRAKRPAYKPPGKVIVSGATSGLPTSSWICACLLSGTLRGLPSYNWPL
jgi:hypothetical protein